MNCGENGLLFEEVQVDRGFSVGPQDSETKTARLRLHNTIERGSIVSAKGHSVSISNQCSFRNRRLTRFDMSELKPVVVRDLDGKCLCYR